ncbi:MAG: DUF4058 family protein, partial [Planctomycetaceae bacterium]
MPSPFPGMDPYLEDPSLWPDVHHNLISEIQAVLNRAITPKYHARIEERVYISDEDDPGRAVIIPDVKVRRRTEPVRPSCEAKGTAGTGIAEPLIAT